MQLTAQRGSKVLSVLLVFLIGAAGSAAWPIDDAGGASATPGEGAGAVLPMAVSAAGAEEAVSGTSATGLYRGVVTDRRSEKPVPGAVVIFINEETADTYEATTDEKGAYEVRLPAGEYVVDIRVGNKTYRSTGTFREEAGGRRWTMDFTVGSKLTERDLRIETTPSDVRVVPTVPRPPLEPSRKRMEFLLFLGGLIGVAALAD